MRVSLKVAKNAIQFLEDARQLLLALQKIWEFHWAETSELELVRKIIGDAIPDLKYGPSVPEYTADN